jgi:hypothetical protein
MRDEARAKALDLWGVSDDCGALPEDAVFYFKAGAEWQASRPVTDGLPADQVYLSQNAVEAADNTWGRVEYVKICCRTDAHVCTTIAESGPVTDAEVKAAIGELPGFFNLSDVRRFFNLSDVRRAILAARKVREGKANGLP